MKFNLTIFVSAFCILHSALAGDALITLIDGQQNPIANAKCVLKFFSVPQSRSSGTSIKWLDSFYSDANGQITLTNAAPGKWMVSPVDANLVSFTFNMPVTNGVIRAENWITADAGNTLPPDTMSFGVNTSDRRYIQKNGAVDNVTGTNVNLSGAFTAVAGNAYDVALIATNPTYGNNQGRYFFSNYRAAGIVNTTPYYNATAGVLMNLDSGGYGTVVIMGGSAGAIYLGNSVSGATFPNYVQAMDFIGANSYQSASGGTNIDATGTFYGNAAGLTNLQATAVRVGTVPGWTGIVTNWGVVGFSNRVYYASGIVTNVTRP